MKLQFDLLVGTDLEVIRDDYGYGRVEKTVWLRDHDKSIDVSSPARGFSIHC